jgi:hypothetical protein
MLEVAAGVAGKAVPRLVARYPFLTGEDPESLPGLGELRSIVRDGGALVATADMVHHGAGYGTPREQQLSRDVPETVATARAWIEQGLERLAAKDFAGFLEHSEAVRSDFRDTGPVVAALLNRQFRARIVDLTLVDYADVLATPQPTWVAAALVIVH